MAGPALAASEWRFHSPKAEATQQFRELRSPGWRSHVGMNDQMSEQAIPSSFHAFHNHQIRIK